METLQQTLRRMMKEYLERREAEKTQQVADNTQATQATKQTDDN